VIRGIQQRKAEPYREQAAMRLIRVIPRLWLSALE